MKHDLLFTSLYRHRFARVSVCVPRVRVADVAFNTEETISQMRQASEAGSAVAAFSELGLSGYSNDDLFQQDALLESSLDALERVVAASAGLVPLTFVGLPLPSRDRLYNAAVAVHDRRILGVVPKSYIPNCREFYEKRHFAPGAEVAAAAIDVAPVADHPNSSRWPRR